MKKNRNKLILRQLLLAALGLTFGFGLGTCAPKKPSSVILENASAQSQEFGVHLGLLKASGQSAVALPWDKLINAKTLGSGKQLLSPLIAKPLRDLLTLGLDVQLVNIESGFARVDKYKIAENWQPGTMQLGGKSLAIPLQLTAHADIEIVRVFSDELGAKSAPMISLIDLPLHAEAALKLEKGTGVSLPIEAELVTDVQGDFLKKAWALSPNISKLLTSTATGMLSGSVQGRLLASGQWSLQVARLAGTKVRLRVTRRQKLNASGSVKVAHSGQARLIFLAFSPVVRAFDLKTRWLENLGVPAQDLASLETKYQNVVLPLTQKLNAVKNTLDLASLQSSHDSKMLAVAQKNVDAAITMLTESDISPAKMQRTILASATQEMSKLDPKLAERLERVESQFRAFTDSKIDIAAAIELAAEFSDSFNLTADYVIDLAFPESRLAFEHAVSGRAKWIGAEQSINRSGLPLLNLSVAENIARADANKATKRVERLLTSRSELHVKRQSITFSGLGAATGFAEQSQNNQVFAEDSQGHIEAWLVSLWDFTRTLKLLDGGSQDKLASGFMLPTDSQFQAVGLGNYWFEWSFQRDSSADSMQTSFQEIANLLGPIAFQLGMPQLYKGEFSGTKHGSMLVLLKKVAIERLFDQRLVTDDVLWQALANTAATFDNKFGLPYNTFGGLPQKWENSAAAQKACTTIAKEWGQGYCGLFAENLIEKIGGLRGNSSALLRMELFKFWYSQGLLANRIGSRLLLRFLTELSFLTQKADAPADFVLRFSLSNLSRPDPFASPSFLHGDPAALEVVESLARF